MHEKATPTNAPIRTLGALLLVGFTIALIYLFISQGKGNSPSAVILKDLKGVWTTTHPGYHDRFLEFTESTVTFGRGGSDHGSYTIDAIDSEPADRETLVQIRYHDLATTDYQLRFYYVKQGDGVIRMKNQKDLYWFRTSGTPTHSPQFK